MILLKSLIRENLNSENTITPGVIYNFYFLWYLYVNQPQLFQTDYGQFILDEYIKKLKEKYLDLFKQLMSEQIVKYIRRNRIDPDFDTSKTKPIERAEVLWHQMEKTFRSDLKRRNDVWNLVGEYLTGLERASSVKDMFIYIDRLNSCIHNTQTLILGKFSGGGELMKAYDTAHNHSPQQWKQFVSKDIRQIENQNSITERKKKK
jgi:hypothetical protein